MSPRRPRSAPRANGAGGLLDRLAAAVRRGAPPETFALYAELERVRGRLAAAPAAARAELDRLAGDLRRPLQLLTVVASSGRLAYDTRAQRDLRTALRRLEVLAERLDERGVGDAELGMHFVKLDLGELVRRCCAPFTTLADDRGIRFAVDAQRVVTAEGDAEKLQSIVLNLLFNAFKHTPPGGAIRCALAVDPARHATRLEIEDGGPPLPPSRAEAIFHRSRHLERSSPTLSALGIHLARSRDFARLHGGELTVRNDTRGGVVFELHLPAGAPRATPLGTAPPFDAGRASRVAEVAREELAAEAALGAANESPHDPRPQVLIALHVRSLHRLLAECLDRDYRVVSVFDGEAAVDRAEALRPDLILAGSSLPGRGGRALVRALRERSVVAPIVVLTAPDDPDEDLALLASGAADVIHEPFLPAEVAARVRNLVDSKRARDLLNGMVGRQEADLAHLAQTVVQQQRELQAVLAEGQRARDAAERANRIKSNFLRMVSHELKTPLTAMQLQLGMLEREAQAPEHARLREGHARLWRASRRLLHLIDTMLEWARVESGRGRVVPERIDLVALVEEVVAELAGQAKQKQLTVAVRLAPDLAREVISDRRLLTLVLLNLLGRALQLTPSGTVELRVDAEHGLHRISITDAAPARYLESGDPFEPSYPGNGGAGLGLHVVRDLARAFGADVTFERPDRAGHVVTVSVPDLTPERTGSRGPWPAPEPPAAAPH